MIDYVLQKWASKGKLSKLLIVNSHNILPPDAPRGLIGTPIADFKRQVTWLKKNFTVLPLEEAIVKCRCGLLLKPTAAITFDDGYETQNTLGAGTLKSMNLPATFFVSSGQLAENIMWNDWFRLFAAQATDKQMTRLESMLDISIEYGDHPRSNEELHSIETSIKYRTLENRKPIIEFMRSSVPEKSDVLRMMDEHSIKQLTKDGFEVGAHSLTHPILALECEADAERQISQDIENLNSIVEIPITSFAIPNGKPAIDYTERHIKMLARNGIRRVMTSSFGHFSPGRDPMQVARVSLTGSSELHYCRIVRQAYTAPANIVPTRGYENRIQKNPV